jgi:hypothetical protein
MDMVSITTINKQKKEEMVKGCGADTNWRNKIAWDELSMHE